MDHKAHHLALIATHRSDSGNKSMGNGTLRTGDEDESYAFHNQDYGQRISLAGSEASVMNFEGNLFNNKGGPMHGRTSNIESSYHVRD